MLRITKVLILLSIFFTYFGSIGISIYYIHRHNEQSKQIEHQQLVIKEMEKEISELKEYGTFIIINGYLPKDQYHKQRKLEILTSMYYDSLIRREKKAKDFERLIKTYDEESGKLWKQISNLDSEFMKVEDSKKIKNKDKQND